MKMQRFVVFQKNNLKINMLKIKKFKKLETNDIILVNKEVLHIAYVM